MIKSEKGMVTVKGNRFDLVFECNHLIRALIKDDPDLILAVIYKNNELLVDAVNRCDNNKLQAIEECIDDIERIREDIDDED